MRPSHIDRAQELERAKLMIEELEENLRVERSRLRALTTEQTKAERQKEEVVLQLRRTESVSFTHLPSRLRLTRLRKDMGDIREELRRIKHENHELENELRSASQ